MMLLGLMPPIGALFRKPDAPSPLPPMPESAKDLARTRPGSIKASVWPLRGVDGRPFHERKPR